MCILKLNFGEEIKKERKLQIKKCQKKRKMK